MQRQAQQLAVTKAGTLWLLDYADGVTVKVSSVHCADLQQAQVLPAPAPLLLTCAHDGSAKLTDLSNLEQSCEVYKPRRQARAFSLGPYTLVGFGEEVCVYSGVEAGEGLRAVGSFSLEEAVVCI